MPKPFGKKDTAGKLILELAGQALRAFFILPLERTLVVEDKRNEKKNTHFQETRFSKRRDAESSLAALLA